eukprot:878609-Pelagomonas_calceolata.AAC.1
MVFVMAGNGSQAAGNGRPHTSLLATQSLHCQGWNSANSLRYLVLRALYTQQTLIRTIAWPPAL